MMHKPEHTFKKCLQEGAASHKEGRLYQCNRKTEECHLRVDFGMGNVLCATPLKETIRKEEKARAEG